MLLSHPIVLLFVQYITTALILGFTTPTSVFRLASLPLVAICSAICVPACKAALFRNSWAALVGGYSITYLFQYITLALLSGCSYESDGPASQLASRRGIEKEHAQQKIHDDPNKLPTLTQSFWMRLQFGISAASSFRWTGTERQVKNIPHFSASDPSYVPSRATFLRQTAIKVVVYYLFIDLLGLGGNDEGMSAALFDSSKVPFFTRLDQISLAEVLMRYSATLAAGLGIYCSQEGLYSILAFVTVALGLSKAEYWRPRFGAMGDAYTVRRFWSFFWHQNNRHMISEPTHLITANILKLPKRSIPARYVSLVLMFLLSGILHMVIDVASGIPWQDSGAIRFFCTQPLGIILEESAQAVYGSSPMLQRLCKPRMVWVRLLGYAWVLNFMVWTVPAYMYPLMSRTRSGMQDSFLPYSILGNLV